MSNRVRCGIGLVILALAGCQSFRLNGLATGRADRPIREAAVAQGPTPPGKYQFRDAQFLYLSDFELKQNQEVFRDLARLGDQVTRELKLPAASTPVQVYIFETKERFEHFMQARFPDLPRRRAFFVAQPRAVGGSEDLQVFTFWGDRIQEDLRHELTHALLHSVLKDVPLWLDEGLAEFFEVPPDARGVNARHLEHLRRGPPESFRPDLARLEGLREVQQMTPAEYREAWAWVHLMLRDKPEAKAVLTNYLQQLRTNPNPGTLGPRLAAVYPDLNAALSRHLARVEPAGAQQRAQGSLRIQ